MSQDVRATREQLDGIKELLNVYRRPDRLAESAWVESCLAKHYLAQNPDLTPRTALMAVLDQNLSRLEQEAPRFARLLRERFKNGLTYEQTSRKLFDEVIPERSFYDHQKAAVTHFARILLEQEALCRQEQERERSRLAAPENHVRVDGRTLPRSSGEIATDKQRWLIRFLIGVSSVVFIVVGLTWAMKKLGGQTGRALTTASTSAPMGTVAVGMASGTAQVCGERERLTAESSPRLLRHHGVSAFTVENTGGRVLNNFVRVVAADAKGAWLGYHADTSRSNGLGQFDDKYWADCNSAGGTSGMNVNDVAVDQQGHVWVAAEKIGVAMFDGSRWRRFTTADGLPSADTFALTIDGKGSIWVGTWDGVAKFDGQEWSVPYTVRNKTIFDNHVHAIAFDPVGNVWVGHINAGVSEYRVADGMWVHHTKAEGQLGGDQVRAILVRPGHGQHLDQVWIATADGGVSVYEKGTWRVYRADDGVPGNDTRDLALDGYDRVWVAGSGGVAYFDDKRWQNYHTLDAYSVAIGPDCRGCPFDTDQVLTGTGHYGLTHSRIPLESDGVQIMKADFPKVVKPGEKFVPEIVVAPIDPYKLREDRGDMLINTDEDEALRFGAFEHVMVRGVVNADKAYIFSVVDTPMIAPQLSEGINEQTFTSTWRVWMNTRYVGPPIHITFTVRR